MTQTEAVALASQQALEAFNADLSAGKIETQAYGPNGTTGYKNWDFGTPWSNIGTEFETFVNKYFYPKIQSTISSNVALGNRFDFLAREIQRAGQITEEYVVLDSIPEELRYDAQITEHLKKAYPENINFIYGQGVNKVARFTLNDQDAIMNFSTVGDAISYASKVFLSRISGINQSEESEMKAMIVDYALNNVEGVREVTNFEELVDGISLAMLNMQNNSHKYNQVEKFLKSQGRVGRFSTRTPLSKVMIVTTDKVKNALLNTKIANSFHIAGIDYTDRIVSFDDLGGAFKITSDVTLDATAIASLKAYGQVVHEVGDVIKAGTIITFDPTGLEAFADADGNAKFEEIKPASENVAIIMDMRSVTYLRDTHDMVRQEQDPYRRDTNYFLHYKTNKIMSPCYNKIVIQVPVA